MNIMSKYCFQKILSKKIRKPKPNTTEFGAVQDDGLGQDIAPVKD